MRGAQHVILARGNVTPENACQTSVPVAPPTFSQALLFLFATPQRTRSRHTHGSIHKNCFTASGADEQSCRAIEQPTRATEDLGQPDRQSALRIT